MRKAVLALLVALLCLLVAPAPAEAHDEARVKGAADCEMLRGWGEDDVPHQAPAAAVARRASRVPGSAAAAASAARAAEPFRESETADRPALPRSRPDRARPSRTAGEAVAALQVFRC